MMLLMKLVNLKERMDQVMHYFLVDVHQFNAFSLQNGRGMRAIRLINWIVLLFAIISAAILFYWFFTSAKLMMASGIESIRGRIAAFFNNNPWTENDTLFSVSIAVKPIHLIEYVNQTNNTGSAAANEQSIWFK